MAYTVKQSAQVPGPLAYVFTLVTIYELFHRSRDAIAKALYQRLFTWLVERINSIVKVPEDRSIERGRQQVPGYEKYSSIAILDIFGFEVSQRTDLLL